MNHPTRRQDRAISREQALGALSRATYGTLATIDEAQRPYGTPVTFVVLGDTIYLHGTTEPSWRNQNAAAHPFVCLTVVSTAQALPEKFSMEYESAIARGTLRLVTNEAEKRAALMAFLRKYSPAHLEKGMAYLEAAIDTTSVQAIAIEELSGKARR